MTITITDKIPSADQIKANLANYNAANPPKSAAPAAAPSPAPASNPAPSSGYDAKGVPVGTDYSGSPHLVAGYNPAFDTTQAKPSNTSASNQDSGKSTAPAYYPRGAQTPNASDPAFSAAQAGQTPSTTAPTPDDFFSKIYAQLAPVIDAIGQNEASAETQANITARKAESGKNASLNARGMAGSSEATAEQGQVDEARNAAIQTAKATQATDVANLVQWAIPQAYSEFKDALSRFDTQSEAYIKTQQDKASNTVKAVAAQGVPLDDLKVKNPDEYNQLLQYYNGNEIAMRADWIAGAAPLSLDGGKPIQAGSHLIYTFKDPVTGKPFTQDIDTGINLTADWSTARAADGSIIQYNKVTGQSIPLGGGNPFYIANQKATLDAKNQRIKNTNSIIANRLISSQVKADAAIQNFLKIEPLMDSINVSIGEINNGNLNEETAARILDNITQLNTGGKVITEGQIDLTKESQSYADQAKVLMNKISGSGGIIDKKVANDMASLAQKTYDLYQKQYQKHVQVYNNKLKNSPAGDLSQYSPLTDISNLSSVVDGSYAAGLEAAKDTTTINNNASTAGTDNGDGTITAPDGTVYTITD